MIKKIAILTSGGDCAGLNAVIRAVTLRAYSKYKWEVYGIKDGTLGLLREPLDILKLEPNNFDGNLMRMGGTFLGSNNKGNPFKKFVRDEKKIDSTDIIIENFKKIGIDALIGIGGDGSLKILQSLTLSLIHI